LRFAAYSDAIMSAAPQEINAPVEVPPAEIGPENRISAHETSEFLAIFRHRNYRLFFFGQSISQVGNWINNVAQGWLIYDLTHSPLLLGMTAFAGQVPVFFFSILGGVIADRFDRRLVLIATQALSIVESAGLAGLVFFGEIRPWHIVALALFQGLVNAVDIPARQAMTSEMVGKEDLRQAISLNSMMFNLARLIAPPLAGILIVLLGAGFCFAIDALSYGAVLTSLFWMRSDVRISRRIGNPLREMRDGFLYAWHRRELRVAIMLIAICSAFGASYVALLPAFATDVLRQGSEGLGLLYGAVGGGALVGGYVLARVPDRHLFATPIIAALAFGISLIAFSLSRTFPISVALLLPTAFSLMLLGGSTSTLIQTVARDDMRGRVVALYAMGFMGMMPWGALLSGWVAQQTGAATAVMIGGAVCILAAMAAWFGILARGSSYPAAGRDANTDQGG
jgi:MFS family permease